MKISSLFLLLIIITHHTHAQAPKIVGLIPMHNEELLIAPCLKALSMITDAIVVLDDASQDGTVAIVKSLQKECNIERIYEKKVWYRDEPSDRNMLLKLGREIGGTHFVVIDADEMFTATLLEKDYLRNLIYALQPGNQLILHWIGLWKSINQFRSDGILKGVIFCDDGVCFYESDFIHTPRIPAHLKNGTKMYVKPYTKYGLLHFQAANWHNMQIRRAWYHCIMRIRQPQLTDQQINEDCSPKENDASLVLAQSPQAWFAYPFFDPSIYEQQDYWREQQIMLWFKEFGKNHFKGLNIWHIDFK